MNVYLAECIGTTILILLGNGVVANVVLQRTKGHDGGWIVVTAGWCLAVTFGVYCVGRISGAHINPAVTLGLASVGEFNRALVPGYIAAQLAGGVIGGVLVFLAYLPHWKETPEEEDKLSCFATSPAVRQTASNFVCEVIGTAMLVFGVLAIGAIAKGAGDETIQEGLIAGFGSWFGPLLVGLLVFSIGLSLGGPTGYAINPARDLGPRIAHALLPIPGKGGSDWSYAWIPVLAPIVGGLLGAQLFVLLGL